MMVSGDVSKNRNHGAPEHGDALLAGLIRCRRRGRKLTLRCSGMKHQISRYSCSRGWMDSAEPRCITFGGLLRVDDAIQDALLTVVGPGTIAAADNENFSPGISRLLPRQRVRCVPGMFSSLEVKG